MPSVIRFCCCTLLAATLAGLAHSAHADILDWLFGGDQGPDLASEYPTVCENYTFEAMQAVEFSARDGCNVNHGRQIEPTGRLWRRPTEELEQSAQRCAGKDATWCDPALAMSVIARERTAKPRESKAQR